MKPFEVLECLVGQLWATDVKKRNLYFPSSLKLTVKARAFGRKYLGLTMASILQALDVLN